MEKFFDTVPDLQYEHWQISVFLNNVSFYQTDPSQKPGKMPRASEFGRVDTPKSRQLFSQEK